MGIGSIVKEIVLILYRFQCENIPAEVRGLCNPAHTVEAELYIRALVVVEEASRSKHHFLAAQPQTTAMFAADMRTYLEKCLVDVPGILIHSSSRATHSPCRVVELEFREQPEIAPRMEIEMWHHPGSGRNRYGPEIQRRTSSCRSFSYSMRYSSPKEIYLCGPSPPRRMYFAGSKMSGCSAG